MGRDSGIVGEGQVGYAIVGAGEKHLILEELTVVMDEKHGKVCIVTDSDQFDKQVRAFDVNGLRYGYQISEGSIISTPSADYICVDAQDGVATFVRKEGG